MWRPLSLAPCHLQVGLRLRWILMRSSDAAIGIPYFDYQFTVKSRKTGRLDALDPILIDHDGDDANNNRLKDNAAGNETAVDNPGAAIAREYSKQPAVRVGNILGAKGSGDDADELVPIGHITSITVQTWLTALLLSCRWTCTQVSQI